MILILLIVVVACFVLNLQVADDLYIRCNKEILRKQ